MLNNNKDNIGKLFRDVIEGFEEDLPNRVWDNVNSELKKEKKRKKIIFYLSIAASIAVIIAFSSGYFIALNNSKYSNSIINKELNKKSLVNTVDSKTNLKNNNTLSFQQNNKDLKQDTNNVINNSITQNEQDLIAINNFNNLTADTVNTKRPIIDIIKDFKKDVNNQADILNANQNIANNNISVEKIQEPGKAIGKWSLAGQFSPVCYLGNSQKANFGDQAIYGYSAINQSNNETINDKNISVVYATGINLKYQFNKKWGVKSGVFYATGELYSGQQHKQIEVPVMANYTLINKKIIWGINGGFGTNILFFQGEKNINYSGLFGTTIGYNISRKISINIEPTIKYNFSYPNNYIFHYYPYSFAIYTGLSYNI